MDLLSLINSLVGYGLQYYTKSKRKLEMFGEDWYCLIENRYILFKCLSDGGTLFSR